MFRLVVVISSIFIGVAANEPDPLVYTVATEETDGFMRYIYSAETYKIKPIILGKGETWKGGDIQKNPGGGWKVNLLKEALQPLKNEKDQIVLFTDGYDVIFLNNLNAIVEKFKQTGARVLFGAEGECWPDRSLESKYPKVEKGKRFLNSGLFMSYVPELLQILEYAPVADTDDDQLLYTLAYLDENLRDRLNFKLDHTSEIFQNLYAASGDIELYNEELKEGSEFRLKNIAYKTEPLILHGNGSSKRKLNSLGNYLARAWTPDEGCKFCKWGHLDLKTSKLDQIPVVLISVFVEQATPFLEEQLRKIYDLEYPKKRIHLFVHNAIKYHTEHVNEFLEKYAKDYVSVKKVTADDAISEWSARDLSLDYCLKKKCDLYFAVDSLAHLDNPHSLRLLAEQNRTVVAPLLRRPEKAWSNFWGALTTDGFYARSHDYMDIVNNVKRGLWNVPFVSSCYLVNATLLRKYDRSKITYVRGTLDADMAFCANLRDLDVFLYVSNRLDFGHLVNPETFDITRAAPDMYQIFDNEYDWTLRYIHPEYAENFNPDKKPLQPCPDVYWFPMTTERFCNDLIYMMETFGQWSDGSSKDPRLSGGYEAVPTRDIHMNQVGWEPHWLAFLQKFVRPVQEHVFIGYFHDPPRSLMNFVVRYKPDEQPELRPHHDSSTYTVNIALNRRGVDYEGGGCRFIRYNCSIEATKQGWMLLHPGRLTHYHEGLRVTSGIRYIMISFVDP